MIVDILFVVLALILIFAIYKLKFKKDAQEISSVQVPREEANVHENIPVQAPRWAQNQQDNSDLDEDSEDKERVTLTDRKKQMRKEEKAKERQQQKEAREYHFEQEKLKREKQDEENEEQERLEEEKRQKEEEYYRMLAEEEEAKKKAEYEKWKGLFSVDTEGKAKDSAEVEERKKEELLKSLLEVLNKNKLSLLEDLTHKFRITTKELIEKIRELEARGSVQGIFDERGKYLVIESKEWEAIRNYMEARGRVKKIDIMQECSRIIKIPDESEVDLESINLIDQEVNANN